MTYITGVDPTETHADSDPQHLVGSRGMNVTSDGVKEYIYVHANGAITGEGYVCLIENDFEADMINTTNSAPGSGQGLPVGVPQVAFSDNEYGWLQVLGDTNVRVSASAAAATELNTTGTDGELDDDGSAGAEVVNGVALHTAEGSGSAAIVAGHINYPIVGRTL